MRQLGITLICLLAMEVGAPAFRGYLTVAGPAPLRLEHPRRAMPADLPPLAEPPIEEAAAEPAPPARAPELAEPVAEPVEPAEMPMLPLEPPSGQGEPALIPAPNVLLHLFTAPLAGVTNRATSVVVPYPFIPPQPRPPSSTSTFRSP